ncbi:MAG: hypothetical protein ACTSUE_04945 [Promethearchaeota archaeon]
MCTCVILFQVGGILRHVWHHERLAGGGRTRGRALLMEGVLPVDTGARDDISRFKVSYYSDDMVIKKDSGERKNNYDSN